jgi:hypothetical protein
LLSLRSLLLLSLRSLLLLSLRSLLLGEQPTNLGQLLAQLVQLPTGGTLRGATAVKKNYIRIGF